MTSLLVDTSHIINIFDKHVFSIVYDCKLQRCGYTKADSLQLNNYWGYMINRNRKCLGKLQESSKVTLEHMLNNQDYCKYIMYLQHNIINRRQGIQWHTCSANFNKKIGQAQVEMFEIILCQFPPFLRIKLTILVSRDSWLMNILKSDYIRRKLILTHSSNCKF